ncbi:hypothetical protein CAPTEDRAFT_202183 [Capitella teleta]|uniref:Uncharacterized protein n=1 Tax=Capitella teleta TaxID=283909 RepID=R7TJB9_CAPTE|nr:hypothetical protein CAPTEDRAFT_202183 [Capitella teleta]|eukprot:ELT91646.1 hypothetical protein CAPTEDRAFT_202183 [Capitella teleta]
MSIENIGNISRHGSVELKEHELRNFKQGEFLDGKNVEEQKNGSSNDRLQSGQGGRSPQKRAILCNDVDVEIQLLCRNVRFLRSLERSNNRVVRCCFQLVQNGSRSTVSRSFSKLCDVTQKSRHHIVESVCHPTALFKIGNDYEEMAGLVRDLLALRAGLELDQNLSAHDIELLRDINFSIRELCTH